MLIIDWDPNKPKTLTNQNSLDQYLQEIQVDG